MRRLPAWRLERLRYGAHVIREELGLSEDEFETQFEAYRRHLARFHTWPALEWYSTVSIIHSRYLVHMLHR